MTAPTTPSQQVPLWTGAGDGDTFPASEAIIGGSGNGSLLGIDTGDNKTVRLWDLGGGGPTVAATVIVPDPIVGYSNTVDGVGVFVAGTSENLYMVWTVDGHNIMWVKTSTVTIDTSHTFSIFMNAAGDEIILVDYTDGTVSGITSDLAAVSWTAAIPEGGAATPFAYPASQRFLAFSGDGNTIYLCGPTGSILDSIAKPSYPDSFNNPQWLPLENHAIAMVDVTWLLPTNHLIINILQSFGDTLSWFHDPNPVTIDLLPDESGNPIPTVSVWDGQLAIVQTGD